LKHINKEDLLKKEEETKKMKIWLEKYSKIFWIITLVIAIFIFYTSTLTFPLATGKLGITSILYHLSVFFALGFFLLISSLKGKLNCKIYLVIIISVLYGILDELHQFFVPGRYTAFSDILTDSVGIILASTIYLIIIKLKNLKNYKKLIPL